jgi:hypothetical protein
MASRKKRRTRLQHARRMQNPFNHPQQPRSKEDVERSATALIFSGPFGIQVQRAVRRGMVIGTVVGVLIIAAALTFGAIILYRLDLGF